MATATPTIDQADFAFIRKFVYEQSAIALEPEKTYLVESRLGPIARQSGLHDLSGLVAHLRSRPAGELHAKVVEAMTTNETSFFRDAHPIEALRSDILPKLIQSRQSQRTLNIWSAASSSGQEAYTVVMLLREHFPELASWKISVIGTDLSQQMVERAQAGVYSQLEVNRGLPASLLKHFQRTGLQWQLSDEIRKSVKFMRMNLARSWLPLPTMDIIFMRNVLIYFDLETKRQIFARVRRQLAPDGSLLLGGAETTLGVDENFERVNHGKTSSYRLRRV